MAILETQSPQRALREDRDAEDTEKRNSRRARKDRRENSHAEGAEDLARLSRNQGEKTEFPPPLGGGLGRGWRGQGEKGKRLGNATPP